MLRLRLTFVIFILQVAKLVVIVEWNARYVLIEQAGEKDRQRARTNNLLDPVRVVVDVYIVR